MEKILISLKRWFKLLGISGCNSKGIVREEIEKMIEEIEKNIKEKGGK